MTEVFFALVVLFAQVSTTQPAQTTQPTTRPDKTAVVLPGSIVQRDVPFVQNPAAKQLLDVYAPRDAKGAPVVIFVHGGEWARHDKSEVSFKPRFLNENGIVFISVNYRLSDTDKHPAQANDVAAAVRWTRDHVGEYGGDPGKLVLMGHSAGCHLVTLVGLDPKYLAGVGMKPTELAAVVSWSGGAFDLPAKVKEGGMYEKYIRLNFGEDESVWRDASPIQHISNLQRSPRFLFASAEKGNAKSRDISEKMAELIRAAGGRAQTLLLEGKDHNGADHEVGMAGDVTGRELLKFIAESNAR